jgi:two-component system chemotaxis response regulator CheY
MPHHILVVDDDPAIRATVSEVLSDEGYSVMTATNGAEGLAAVQKLSPSVVLLDMRMPVLDGWGFARAMAERGGAPPIVVMTAAHEARRWAQEIGTTLVLAKPFDLDELLLAVERALQSHPSA